MMKKILKSFIVVASVLLAYPSQSYAELRLEITRGNIDPLPIAITDLVSEHETVSETGKNIARVIASDLESSGLFRPIDPRAFIQDPDAVNGTPRFADWRLIKAQALMVGRIFESGGQIKIEFRLFDTFSQSQMVGLSLTADSASWRRLAHMAADAIYERITGEKGYFDTRVVYISESGPKKNRVKRLAIMDRDGENHRFLSDGKTLVLTPRFSPTAQEIVYLEYGHKRQPRVYLINLANGQRAMLGNFPGMTFAPRFSPDGKRVIMSFAGSGKTTIFEMDLASRKSKRLTAPVAIDTSPCYSPDGNQIVFLSDRGGSEQLYVMNADGSGAHRISFGQGRYYTPVWSPRGDLIVFTKSFKGEFYIGVMRPDGSGERLLTKGFLVEGPTWAPNGRVVMFTRQSRGDASGAGSTSRLYSIDLTGFNEREMITPQDASDPAWSPLLQ